MGTQSACNQTVPNSVDTQSCTSPLAQLMPPICPVSYTKKESRLLQLVMQPSGKTIEQLAQQMVEYEHVQVHGAEIFTTDPTQLQRMSKMTHDPEVQPANFFSLNDPGATIHMFSQLLFRAFEILSVFTDPIIPQPSTTTLLQLCLPCQKPPSV
jgi:hypothetical protein